jgi:hypothetical protein
LRVRKPSVPVDKPPLAACLPLTKASIWRTAQFYVRAHTVALNK